MIDKHLKHAAAQSRAALAAGTADAHDHMIMALESAARDDHAAAQGHFDRALSREPGNPAILTGLANWYRQLGRLRDAALACDSAIRIAPDYADAWIERGAVLGVGGSSAASRESYARAIQLQPTNSVALAGLAGQAARDGEMDAARTAAEAALRIDPANLSAAAALALALLHAGEAQAARDLLDARVAEAQPSHARSGAAHALGRAEERLGNFERAYAAYALSKGDFETIHGPASANLLDHRSFIEAIVAGMKRITPGERKSVDPSHEGHAPVPDAAETHIFLMGYPRSGTTLVENILASLPGAHALEEWPTLADADHRFLSDSASEVEDAVAHFHQCDSHDVEELRKAYWRRVTGAGVPAGARAFIDMDPLKGSRLPFIAHLFPDARILILRRDPRDVVWSCFRTNFGVTSNTLEYVTLERAARHYDAMMRLTDIALERLSIQAMELRYSALVRDFDATTRAMCDFVGLPWSEDVRRFDRTALARGVGTASAAQVRRGLYDGSGQWRPFARWLEPVMPLLQPWIDRFGDQ